MVGDVDPGFILGNDRPLDAPARKINGDLALTDPVGHAVDTVDLRFQQNDLPSALCFLADRRVTVPWLSLPSSSSYFSGRTTCYYQLGCDSINFRAGALARLHYSVGIKEI